MPNGDTFGTYQNLTTFLKSQELTDKRGAEMAGFEAHHLLEDRLLRTFGLDSSEGFSVALMSHEHMELAHGKQALDNSGLEKGRSYDIWDAVEGDTQSAIQDYERSIVLEPDNWLGYGNRNAAYRDQGKLNAAISDFDRAIELAPENGSLYLHRASVYANQGKWSAAIKDYTSSIELLSNDSERALALYNRGNAYAAQGKSYAAIEDYSAAIALQPNNAEALNNRALLYRKDKQFAAALADLKQALELDPEDDTTRFNIQFNLGLTNYDLNDYEAAAEAFRSAAEISPGSADALAYYGNVKLQQKDFQTALEFCNRALEIDPRNTVARLCRTAADLQLLGSD